MASLIYPLSTEKALNMIDKNNTISYIVDLRSNKQEIKKEFEDIFGVKVVSINTEITLKNTKRAYIKLKPEFKASDIARKLKLV
ncbi:MAG: 50S ribosomal protein L23 [Candidatus Micrarchaeaceae archaeon]